MKKLWSLSDNRYFIRLCGMLLGVLLLFSLLKPDMFLKGSTFQSMFVQFPEYGVMALGVMLAFISGCIDMSFLYLANLCAILAILVMRNVTRGAVPEEMTGTYILYGVLAALSAGALAGVLNGLLIAKVNIPPILATLATGQIFSGIAKALTRGKAVSGVPVQYAEMGAYKLFGVLPMPLVLFGVCALGVGFLLKKTTYGSNLFLLGSNRTVAYFSGMRVTRQIVLTFVLCGVLSALGGLIMVVSYNSAKPDYGTSYIMQCILIAVLGGVSPNGGIGGIGGVLLAIFMVQVISTGFNMFSGVSNYLRSLLTGSLLLIMMMVNYLDQNPRMSGRRLHHRFKKPPSPGPAG